MTRSSFAFLAVVALLSSTGCAAGDHFFGVRSDSCTTNCASNCCSNGSCNCGTCNNGACGNGACGNGACGNGACGHCDGSSAMAMNGTVGPGDPAAYANGCDPNGAGPNGYGPNGPGPYGPEGYGHPPLPRGVGGTWVGPEGPPTGGVAYPYYTNRGPRDYLDPNPPSIGP